MSKVGLWLVSKSSPLSVFVKEVVLTQPCLFVFCCLGKALSEKDRVEDLHQRPRILHM